jgi:hypothetical protein
MQGAGLNLRDESKYYELRFVAVGVTTSFNPEINQKNIECSTLD